MIGDLAALEFIDSFRTLCPLKDIAGRDETCADAADSDIMNFFFSFSPSQPSFWLVFECGHSMTCVLCKKKKKKTSESRLASQKRLVRALRMCHACVFARPLDTYLICPSCCSLFPPPSRSDFRSLFQRHKTGCAHTLTKKKREQKVTEWHHLQI